MGKFQDWIKENNKVTLEELTAVTETAASSSETTKLYPPGYRAAHYPDGHHQVRNTLVQMQNLASKGGSGGKKKKKK